MRRYRNLVPFFVLVLVFGCATLLSQRVPFRLERPQECQEFLNRLDKKVKEAGVNDASSFPVPGFPYLRTNRFLSSLKETLKNDRERAQWVRWMRRLDLQARKKEISNLPDRVILSLEVKEAGQADREGLFARAESCSQELLSHDMARSDFYETLYPFVEVPDEYSFVRRAVGLYPLISIPVIIATISVRDEFQDWYDMKLDDLPVAGNLNVFGPPERAPLYGKQIQELIASSTRNPLGYNSFELSFL